MRTGGVGWRSSPAEDSTRSHEVYFFCSTVSNKDFSVNSVVEKKLYWSLIQKHKRTTEHAPNSAGGVIATCRRGVCEN